MRHTLPLLFVLAGCQEFNLGQVPKDPDENPDDTDVAYGLCAFDVVPAATDTLDGCGQYELGGFTPWVEWHGAVGKSSLALPTVADLDGDGMSEILVNIIGGFPVGFPDGELWVLEGDGTGVDFKITDAKLAMGATPAVADLDGDGLPEILAVRNRGSQLPLGPLNGSKYSLVAWTHDGVELWESETFNRNNYDYAGAPAIADMDQDGDPEIVVGRVIFRSDGTVRGVGEHGRGSWGNVISIGEASQSAIADLDLDGISEVIVGDAMYTPDGETKWHDARREDGMIGVANLDDDPEGEFVAVSGGQVRAHDTDGRLLWGPNTLWCEVQGCAEDMDGMPITPPPQTEPANILSVPAIADLDGDGYPEVVVAGGSQIVAFHHDGTELWTNTDVQDLSGATGASIFDFDGDGRMEVVYIDETSVHAYDGRNGNEVFRSDQHGSNTLFDYPVIADVDSDGSAEIVVTHAFFGKAVTVYGAGDGNWAPTREVWNQHAYSIDNVADDLSIPTAAVQGFTTHNTWHAAATVNPEEGGKVDLQAQIADVCEVTCATGKLFVAVQLVNKAASLEVDAGVKLTLYVKIGGVLQKVDTMETSASVRAGMESDAVVFEVPADLATQAESIEVKVDDRGNGRGVVPECVEDDNVVVLRGPFCAP